MKIQGDLNRMRPNQQCKSDCSSNGVVRSIEQNKNCGERKSRVQCISRYSKRGCCKTFGDKKVLLVLKMLKTNGNTKTLKIWHETQRQDIVNVVSIQAICGD